MLALTATALAGTKKKIIETLSLHKSVQIVVSPNRDNIKLYLQKVTNEISDNFMCLVHELERKQMECPKHQKIEWLPSTTVALLLVFRKLS